MTDSEKEAGLKVIQNYIDGTYQGNVKLLRDCFHKNTVMNGYLEDQLLLGGPELFFENIENNPSMAEGDTPYKGEITSIDVVGNVASAIIKEMGFGGSMAFTDYFHLIKEAGQWKIISRTFTTE